MVCKKIAQEWQDARRGVNTSDEDLQPAVLQ